MDKDITRRQILGMTTKLSAGAVAIRATSEPVEAESSSAESSKKIKQTLKQRYTDLEAARNAVELYADGVLHILFKNGFLNRPSATEFEPLDGHEQPFNHEDASVMAINGNNRWTAVLRFDRASGNQKINLYVLPENERSYAFIRDSDSEIKYTVDEEVDGNLVTPTACSVTRRCNYQDSCHVDPCVYLGAIETFYTYVEECCPRTGLCYFIRKECNTNRCQRTIEPCV